jgi:hypothetical protein
MEKERISLNNEQFVASIISDKIDKAQRKRVVPVVRDCIELAATVRTKEGRR